ncbi:choline ABC transporter ATP-binding protein [Acidisoma cellulosilytica]|uniref:Trimethylamine N-oxide transport system ATP-binding protein TmoW n=1 Tax=Acidisoma cellulosilyticum TaxID=2802395 RepID=A0A963YZ95_9PROT|nr:choline ABC transporter ATP-binding protein [Acidisoma cellulosilyticum]MCB8879831.1 choline ABC transporter ATP-binding protein [Acidisoma cellulosilyticum]
MSDTHPAIEFSKVDILFSGNRRAGKNGEAAAIQLMDQGHTREEILAKTGTVMGVKDASLTVQEGEICVLMGLSGSGKSTLLRAVNGLNKVTRGRVLVRDKDKQVDIANCDRATLRYMRTRRIAMVFQQFALLPWRTVRENVGLGLELRGVSGAERRRIVDEKLKLVALDKWADKYARELSGGMQQRVGLARAFATDADILLMDEPFSALDPLIRSKLQDELLALQKEVKKTIIFVSHDLDEALKLGNQIVILEGGRIIQSGAPEDIVLRPANDYVREFVQHMNPLNVLRGRTFMTPLDSLPMLDGWAVLDAYRPVYLHSVGTVAGSAITAAGAAVPIVAITDETDLPGAGTCAAVDCEATMKTVIQLRQATGMPVLVTQDGQIIGMCGEDEILHALASEGWQTVQAEAAE